VPETQAAGGAATNTQQQQQQQQRQQPHPPLMQQDISSNMALQLQQQPQDRLHDAWDLDHDLHDPDPHTGAPRFLHQTLTAALSL
jgi:hypothetical protein